MSEAPSVTESTIQAVLMGYAMETKKHQFAVPNVTLIYPWEADMISVTSSWLVHEYEIKISRSDFIADKNKKMKHSDLRQRYSTGEEMRKPKTAHERALFDMGLTSPFKRSTPNYFWYVTNGFDIETAEIPSYAGWMTVEWKKGIGWTDNYERKEYWGWRCQVLRKAPRIHSSKIAKATRLKLGRWLSFKLKNIYQTTYL